GAGAPAPPSSPASSTRSASSAVEIWCCRPTGRAAVSATAGSPKAICSHSTATPATSTPTGWRLSWSDPPSAWPRSSAGRPDSGRGRLRTGTAASRCADPAPRGRLVKALHDLVPRHLPPAAHRAPAGLRVSPLSLEAAAATTEDVYRRLQSSSRGLTEAEAGRRRQEYGPNAVVQEARYRRLRLLGKAV